MQSPRDPKDLDVVPPYIAVPKSSEALAQTITDSTKHIPTLENELCFFSIQQGFRESLGSAQSSILHGKILTCGGNESSYEFGSRITVPHSGDNITQHSSHLPTLTFLSSPFHI